MSVDVSIPYTKLVPATEKQVRSILAAAGKPNPDKLESIEVDYLSPGARSHDADEASRQTSENLAKGRRYAVTLNRDPTKPDLTTGVDFDVDEATAIRLERIFGA